MGSVGPGELLLIALIALLLFGAGRVADIGKGLGQGIRNFKEGLRDKGEPAPAEKEAAPAPAKNEARGLLAAGDPSPPAPVVVAAPAIHDVK
jgi:sec-independent protein translocase protein TatA